MNNILWTDETWNPIAGCSVHTPGCTNCYAMKMAARLEDIALADMQRADTGKFDHYIGLTKPSKAGPVWTGQIGIAPDSTLTKPLRWKKPRRIFVNSMSDLFHPNVPDEVIDRVFAVMALCPQHIFQLLTKRSERMRGYCRSRFGGGCEEYLVDAIEALGNFDADAGGEYGQPLPNVWLGVSVEDQARAARVDNLRATPAAVRWISAEPLIASLDNLDLTDIDWVVCGGESGKNARPMHPDWARSLRDQCAAAGVPFFFKQWGEWHPGWDLWPAGVPMPHPDYSYFGEGKPVFRLGKKHAGRLLDGVLHDGFPV